MVLHKKTDLTEEYRVPLKLPVSEQPLFVKLYSTLVLTMIRILASDFPLTKPSIQIMSKVQHKHIEANTFYYNGPVLAGWTDKSSLVHVVQAVHEEFSKQPPMPLNMQGVLQKHEYQPEMISLQKVYF